MSARTTLAELLSVACLAEVARRIDRPHGFVWRLRHGYPLTDVRVIPALAAALHQSEEYLLAVVRSDLRLAHARSVAQRRSPSRALRIALHHVERIMPAETLAS